MRISSFELLLCLKCPFFTRCYWLSILFCKWPILLNAAFPVMLGLYLVLPFSSSYDSRTSNVDILSWLLARWLFLKSKTDDIPRCFSGLFCRTLVASNSTLAIREGFLLIDPVSSIRSPLLISINSKLSWINTYNSLFVAEISIHGTTIPFYQYFFKLASNWFWLFCLCFWDACALTCDFPTRYASCY